MPKMYRVGQRDRIIARDGMGCYCCGRDARDELNIDHVLPRVLGGKTHDENLRVICKRCNSSKCGKTLKQYEDHARKKLEAAREEYEYRLSVVKNLEVFNGKK